MNPHEQATSASRHAGMAASPASRSNEPRARLGLFVDVRTIAPVVVELIQIQLVTMSLAWGWLFSRRLSAGPAV